MAAAALGGISERWLSTGAGVWVLSWIPLAIGSWHLWPHLRRNLLHVPVWLWLTMASFVLFGLFSPSMRDDVAEPKTPEVSRPATAKPTPTTQSEPAATAPQAEASVTPGAQATDVPRPTATPQATQESAPEEAVRAGTVALCSDDNGDVTEDRWIDIVTASVTTSESGDVLAVMTLAQRVPVSVEDGIWQFTAWNEFDIAEVFQFSLLGSDRANWTVVSDEEWTRPPLVNGETITMSIPSELVPDDTISWTAETESNHYAPFVTYSDDCGEAQVPRPNTDAVQELEERAAPPEGGPFVLSFSAEQSGGELIVRGETDLPDGVQIDLELTYIYRSGSTERLHTVSRVDATTTGGRFQASLSTRSQYEDPLVDYQVDAIGSPGFVCLMILTAEDRQSSEVAEVIGANGEALIGMEGAFIAGSRTDDPSYSVTRSLPVSLTNDPILDRYPTSPRYEVSESC